MRRRVIAVFGGAALAAGCGLLGHGPHKVPPPAPPSFSQYHLEGWSWDDAARVVVLPFLNATTSLAETPNPYPRAQAEVRDAFASELQRLGRFEVVEAPADQRAVLSAQIHRGGRFDEAVLLELAKLTRADVIVHGTITHYSPYPRPRIGLVIQAVGPLEGKVLASVDGLWDATDPAVAWRVRSFYRQTPRPRPPWIANNVVVNDDAFAPDLALASPALFQRAICREAALTLLGLPVPGVAGTGYGLDGQNAAGFGGPVPCGAPLIPPAPKGP